MTNEANRPERTYITWPGKGCGLAFNEPAKTRTEYVRADLCASGQQVRALLDENARLNAAMLVLGVYLMGKGEAFRVGEGAELLDAYSAALTPAPQAATTTAQEAVPVMEEPDAVRHSFDGDGWLYADQGNGSDWLKRALAYPDAEPLYTANLYAHPPQPSETVAEAIAAIEALNVIKTGPWCGGYISRKAALRALKGGA